MTPLEAATEGLLSAIGSRDFDELRQALRIRERLLETGSEITVLAWELGENARLALTDLRKNLVLEASRQEQILKVAGTTPARSGSGRAYFG